jgi:hypothetical protein
MRVTIFYQVWAKTIGGREFEWGSRFSWFITLIISAGDDHLLKIIIIYSRFCTVHSIYSWFIFNLSEFLSRILGTKKLFFGLRELIRFFYESITSHKKESSAVSYMCVCGALWVHRKSALYTNAKWLTRVPPDQVRWWIINMYVSWN